MGRTKVGTGSRLLMKWMALSSFHVFKMFILSPRSSVCCCILFQESNNLSKIDCRFEVKWHSFTHSLAVNVDHT